MHAVASMIVYDSGDIRLNVAATLDALRADLIEYYNEQAEDWELEPLPEDATMPQVQAAISENMGHGCLIQDTWVVAA